MTAFNILIVALAILGLAARGDSDNKRYSYVCLETNQDLCLGISPGESDPIFDPNALYYLQVKSRTKNAEMALDYRKMRWDLFYGQGKVALSNFTSLCATKIGDSNQAALFPCNASFPRQYNPKINYGRWSLGPLKTDPNGSGMMMLAGNSNKCLTAMRCDAAPGESYCNKDSDEVAWSNKSYGVIDLRAGSYLKFKQCYDRPNGVNGWKNVQIWRQRLDCAPGCPPMLQDNDVCDAACDNAACDWDNGKCATSSPSKASTLKPTTPTLTKAPTSPTTKSPTVTRSPTTPTAPTQRAPTTSPTVTCPATLSKCNSFRTRRLCLGSAANRRICSWCLNGCRPKSDPRACTVPGIFDNCKPPCPSAQAFTVCSRIKVRSDCRKRRKLCSWCGTANKCQPGTDARICKDLSFYSYCLT